MTDLQLSDKVRNWFNSNFHNEGKVISPGTFNKKDCVIIHLENMKKHEKIPILIKGFKYNLIKTDKHHIWVIEND